MEYLIKRWHERSTKVQVLQLGAVLASMVVGVPVETMANIVMGIAGLGAGLPDS